MTELTENVKQFSCHSDSDDLSTTIPVEKASNDLVLKTRHSTLIN